MGGREGLSWGICVQERASKTRAHNNALAQHNNTLARSLMFVVYVQQLPGSRDGSSALYLPGGEALLPKGVARTDGRTENFKGPEGRTEKN